MPLDLRGLPWFVGELIQKTIANDRCSPDALLLIADALQEVATQLPAQTVYREPCERTVSQLRDIAAQYAKPPPERETDA